MSQPSDDALANIFMECRKYLVQFGIDANRWGASYRHGGSNWISSPIYAWGDVKFSLEGSPSLSIRFDELMFNIKTGEIKEYKPPRLEET